MTHTWRRGARGLLIGAVVMGLVAVSPMPSAAADELVVVTGSGALRGVGTGRTREWRGIPYIAPPVGDLRWRPPQPAPPWDGVRDATRFGSRCPQLAPSGVIGDEDCVNLNVFAPATAAGQPLPVMVHLHGGSNSGFWAYPDAASLVEHGVIVVTVDYRLGVFGFVGHPALSAEGGGVSGEYGMLDQIAALHWVRDNIAAFGGDPNNVTLFGESAGSFDATALIVSPLAQGLFKQAALQTESFWALNGLGQIGDAEELGVGVADAVGCSQDADVTACLRAVPTSDLVLAGGFLDLSPWTGGLVLPQSPIALMHQRPVTIPLLIGSNREEAAFFIPELFEGTPYLTAFYYRDTNAIAGPPAGNSVRRLYPSTSYDSEMWATIAAFTDALYTCPMRRLGLASDGPVWRYLYTHRLENDPFLASLRASHFLDEPILWGTSQLLEGFDAADYVFTPGDAALSASMATYWTNFAKTGDPNGSGVPGWPTFTDASELVQVLDDPISTTDHWPPEACTLFDTIPEPFPPPQVAARQRMVPH
jgi:para-nitrobenzyl esterase